MSLDKGFSPQGRIETKILDVRSPPGGTWDDAGVALWNLKLELEDTQIALGDDTVIH